MRHLEEQELAVSCQHERRLCKCGFTSGYDFALTGERWLSVGREETSEDAFAAGAKSSVRQSLFFATLKAPGVKSRSHQLRDLPKSSEATYMQRQEWKRLMGQSRIIETDH
jgi:hypothetical protein